MRILETKLIVFHFHGRKSKLWNKIEEMKKHNYMQQTIPIQSWKEGWSARLSWRRCWRPWMDPARLKKQGGTHKLRTKYVYIYIYVDQRWELLAVLLQVFGLKKLLWMYDYLKILPSSHNALCTISQIFLWTVFVIIKNQYILLRPNTRSWAKLSTQHFPFWSPDVFDFLVPCLDGFWRSFFKCFMWHEMYAKHSSKCTVLQLREAIFLRIQPEGSPQFIAFSHLPRIFE